MERKLYMTRFAGLLCALIATFTVGGCAGEPSGRAYDLADGATDRAEVASEANEAEQQHISAGAEEEGETVYEEGEDESTEISYVYVQVCGAVNSPGVYKVESTLRVFEVIELAGGQTLEADVQAINMARPVADEMRIYVPTADEVKSGEYERLYGEDDLTQVSGEACESDKADAFVNINTADKDMLMTLPGIGESRALAIISYREENGPFKNIEDIMNVTGIKQAAFAKLKDMISV